MGICVTLNFKTHLSALFHSVVLNLSLFLNLSLSFLRLSLNLSLRSSGLKPYCPSLEAGTIQTTGREGVAR